MLEDGKTYHVLDFTKLILWKWLYYWKKSADSIQCYQNPNVILHRNRKPSAKIHTEALKTSMSKVIKNNAGGIIIPYFKLYY
jgi:hypothetical protein